MKRPDILRIRLPAGLMAVSLALMAGLLPTVAWAEPAQPDKNNGTASMPSLVGLPAKFHSWDELFAVQESLDRAATRIEEAAAVSSGSGFTSVSVDPESNSVTVYMQGTPAVAERTAINRARADGIHVHVLSARYSRSQLDAQVALIAKDAFASGQEQVWYITKQPDGSGVTVGVGSRPTGATGNATPLATEQVGKTLPHLQRAAAQGSVTVKAVHSEGGPLTREADTPAYWGGAQIINRNTGSGCTSGFAVHWNGRGILTTAAHCGFNVAGTAWAASDFTNGVGTTIGGGSPGNAGYDLMFVHTPAGSAGRFYVGTPIGQPGGQNNTPVWRASHTHIGDWLCVSGAYTGWACSIRASGPTRDCRQWTVPLGLGCLNVEGGISSVNQLIAGHGDSGGPLWVPINGIGQGNSAADARGLVSSAPAGWEMVRCTQNPGSFRNPRYCTTAVWFTDVVSAIRPWTPYGMYVLTA